jgi:hypothetical protein
MPSHTPRYTSGLTDADTTDVDTLGGLLDLTANFSDNDQRARYLLTSNWMHDKFAGVDLRAQERLGRVRGLLAAYGDAEGTPVDYEFLVNQITAVVDDV